jgi:hypothetical protein
MQAENNKNSEEQFSVQSDFGNNPQEINQQS